MELAPYFQMEMEMEMYHYFNSIRLDSVLLDSSRVIVSRKESQTIPASLPTYYFFIPFDFKGELYLQL